MEDYIKCELRVEDCIKCELRVEDYIKCELRVEDCIKCELRRGSQRLLNTFPYLLLYTTHMLCIVAIVDCTHARHDPLLSNQNIPYHVDIVDCTHVRSATASFKDL